MTKLGPKSPPPPQKNRRKGENIPEKDRQTDAPVLGRMMTVQLPMPPSANHLRIPSRGRLITSPDYRAWQEQTGWLIRQAMTPVMRYPCRVWITVQAPNARRDLDNSIKPVLDALVKACILKDDNVGCVNRIFASYQPGHSECVYVSIEAP